MGSRSRAGDTAAQLIAPVLRRGVADLRAAESDIRLDKTSAVHDFRVAARRLRGVVETAESFFDRSPNLEAGLCTAGRAAGPTRDTEVLRQRLMQSLGEEPAGTTVLLLRERLDRELEGQRRRHWLKLVDYLDSPPFDAVTRQLDAFADLTPWTDAAKHPATQVLRPILVRQHSEFDSMVQRIVAQAPVPGLDEGLHDLRQRATAVRYLSDALIPALGSPAKKVRKAVRRVQTVLGDLSVTQLLVAFLEQQLHSTDLDRHERRILQRLRASEVARAALIRSEFLDSNQALYRRFSAS